MNIWTLPQELEISGKAYRINADFRDVLDIVTRLNDETEDSQIRLYVCLSLFYEGFMDMPPENYQEAVQKMYEFISCGEENNGKHPKTIDWEQDQAVIVADVNKVAGCEVRSLPFCHWWTFIAWFNSIGEGQLSTIVSIREKKQRRKKLTDWEKDFYKKNKSKIEFKTKYTQEEEDFLAALGFKTEKRGGECK